MQKEMNEKKWKQMTRSERKVAIAKDVIAQIHAKRITPRSGNYFSLEDYDIFDDILKNSQKNQEHMKHALKNKCQACAKGSMMVCKIAKFNNTAISIDEESIYAYDDNETTLESLKDAFYQDELDLIEACFERQSHFYQEFGTQEFNEFFNTNVEKWGPNNPEDRLLCIMQNIIDHRGNFEPSVKYVTYWV